MLDSQGFIILVYKLFLIRQQRVVLNEASSDLTSVRAVVPKGSLLGPLLFLICIYLGI